MWKLAVCLVVLEKFWKTRNVKQNQENSQNEVFYILFTMSSRCIDILYVVGFTEL